MGKIIIILCLILALLIIFGLAIVNYSYQQLVASFKRYNHNSGTFLTSIDLINLVSKNELKRNIRIFLNDSDFDASYCHAYSRINLPKRLAYSNTVSALAITAHELGHAIQFNDNIKKYNKYNRHLRISNIITKFILPFLIAGIILLFFENLFIFSCVAFALSLLSFIISLSSKVATIKIEKEASENALVLLKKYADFDDNLLKESKSMLKDAWYTYVASFLRSLLKWTMLTRKF